MGCDIHGWVEKKVGDRWVGYLPLKDRTRNYARFAALAGVRGEGPDAKGVPDDVSESTKIHIDEWDSDGHSHSHLNLREADQIFKATNYGDDYHTWHAFDLDLDEENEWDQYRFVFWFDN